MALGEAKINSTINRPEFQTKYVTTSIEPTRKVVDATWSEGFLVLGIFNARLVIAVCRSCVDDHGDQLTFLSMQTLVTPAT